MRIGAITECLIGKSVFRNQRESENYINRKYQIIRMVLFLIGIFLLGENSLFAQSISKEKNDSVTPLVSKEITHAKKMRIVRIGYYPFDGFNMFDKHGKRCGYGYDYLQKLRNYTNWKYEYSDPKYEWPEMLNLLRTEKVDLIAGVSKNSAREVEFAFSKKPVFPVSTVLTVKAGNTHYRSEDYAYWNGIRVGMLKNSTQNEKFLKFSKEKNFSFQPVYFEKLSVLTSALQTGREIDAAVSSSLRAIKSDEWVIGQFNQTFMYIAVRKKDAELLKELDKGMEQLETFQPDIQKNLYKTYYSRDKAKIIPFSPQESAFINSSQKSKRVFTVILNPDRKPFSWLENGQYRGIFKDYADEVSRRTGLKFQFIPVQSREEYYAKRLSPETDIVFDTHWNFQEAEKNNRKLTQPYFSASVSKLRGKRVGNVIRTVSVLKDDELEEKICDILSGDMNVRFCNSLSENISEIKNSISDLTYIYTRSAEYAIYEDDDNRLVSEYVPSLEILFAMGIREDLDPILLTTLNHALLSFDESFANHLRTEYAPKFKEVFSFRQFITRYPLVAIVVPTAILLMTCIFMTCLLIIWNHHRKELQLSVTKWNVASRVAKLCPFRMNIKTRRIYDNQESLDLFWPIENGSAIEIRDWVCPEDIADVEKVHNDLVEGKCDQFWVSYRVKKNGSVRHFISYAVRDIHDPEKMVGIFHDITDSKELELQRDAVQRLWEKVANNAPIMMFVKSETDDFRYVQCNRNFAEFIGRTPEEVTGHTDAELFNRPEDAEAFRERDRKVMASTISQKFQETIENAAGELRHIQTIKMSLTEGSGRSLLIGMSTDVTDLQNSRDEARRHEEVFRLTIQSIGDGVLTTDENGNIQMLNPVAEQLIGLKIAQVKGRPHEEIFRIISAIDGKQVVSPLRKALEGGKVVEFGNHTDLLSFDGNRYHIADCAGPIRNHNNDIIGAVLIFRNVTDEYKQREELRAAITLWNVASDLTKLAPFRMHIPTRRVYGDEARLNQFWPVLDGKAISPKDWIYSEDYEPANREYEKFVSGEKNSLLITYRVAREGKLRYFRRYAVRDVKDPDMMVGIVQDITLDKELERDRDASHALWEQVVNAMPILMFVKSADDDFRYTQCNRNFANFIGREIEDIIGHTDMEFFPRLKEKTHFRNWDSKIMEEGKVQEFYEEAQGADKYYHFQTVKMPYTDAKGKRFLIGLAVDISAYKKAEEERNAAQKLLNNAFKAMPIILYIKSAEDNFRYIQCNDNFCKLFGKMESEIIGRTDQEIFPHYQEAATFLSVDRETMSGGKPVEIIESLSGADGKLYHFRTVKMPSKDINGKAILVGMAVDITEIVQQREQIQMSRFQLEVGCLMTRSFTFELDADRKISTTNGLYEELFPHVYGKPLSLEEWVLSEDIQAVFSKISVFFEQKCPEVTINFRTDWFEKRRYYKCILKTDNGRVFGVISDVTELLEVYEEVKANALMWKQIMDELPVRFFVKDVDNDCRYIMCNKANADFLGLPEEFILGKKTEEICPSSPELFAYLEDEQKILVEHKVNHNRINLPDPNGIIREMEKIEMPITGIGNRLLLVSIAFDITEREQNLRLAEISARILAGVVAEPDFNKVLNHIGKAAIEILHCRGVIFAKCDSQGRLHFLQDTDAVQNCNISERATKIHEYYCNYYHDQLKRNEFVVFERMRDDPIIEPLFNEYPEYREMAFVAAPVVDAGKLQGIMIISFKKTHVFTENEARTLRAICNCIMLAENRSQQNEALLDAQKEQAFQLAERTALNECIAIFMGSDYMEIPFEKILESIRSHLGGAHCYVLQTNPATNYATCLAEANADNEKFLSHMPPLSFNRGSMWHKEFIKKSLVGWSDLSSNQARTELDESWLPLVDKYKVSSLWIAAIEVNEKIWGTLCIAYDDKSTKTFNPKDESFVRSAARVVSLILTRAQHRNDLMIALDTQLNTVECLRWMVGEEDAFVAMRHLLDIIRKHTRADVAFMTELCEDSVTNRMWGKLIMDSGYLLQDKNEVTFGSHEEWYLLFKMDKPLFIENTQKEPTDKILGSWAFLLHQTPPVQSYYEIPIHCDGKLWGSIGIMYTEKVTLLNQNYYDFMMNAKKFFEILLNRQENTRKLNEALQLAKKAEKAKSYFLASMSHELRTPLNAVIGFTEMMKESKLIDENQKEFIENISIAGNALLQLINDILDLSKLEADQMQLVPERVEFPKYCRDVCRTFQYSANKKNLDLVIDVPESMPPLLIDQMRMRQIFFNLVGNSVKFTPNGGTVKVSASFSQMTVSTGALLLKFADTGIGMPEEDQKKIFEPFVQLSKMRGTNASNNGTGLGLPIVRRLVDRMGGTLTVESNEGVGTTFFILLPKVNIADNGMVNDLFSSPMGDSKQIAVSFPSDDTEPTKNLSVLVVDDVPINLKIFSILLKRYGVSYKTATSGQEALEILKDNSFDWIMTDWYMQKMSGVELAEIIRENPAYKNIHLAVVTADVDALAFDKNLFDVVLSKPIDRKQLYQCLFGGEK